MKFVCIPNADGAALKLEKVSLTGRKSVPHEQWRDQHGDSQFKQALRFLEHALNAGEISRYEEGLFLPADFLVSMPFVVAQKLGVPPLAGLSVKVSMRGRVDSSDGALNLVWQDSRSRHVMPQIDGPFIRIDGVWHRLSSELHEIHQAADAYNTTLGQDFQARLPRWQRVQEILKTATGREIRADQFVGALTIYQAGAFSLDVRETSNGPDFLPVLMARTQEREMPSEDDGTNAPETNGGVVEDEGHGTARKNNETDALLLPAHQRTFSDEVSNAPGSTQAAYVLDRNTYLVVDPSLRIALDAVKSVRGMSAEKRKEFLRNPRTYIAQVLGGDNEDLASRLFVETTQYSERVEGLGVWQKPTLPWLARKPNDWLPERFVVHIGSKTLNATPGIIEEVQSVCQKAEDADEGELVYGNEVFKTSDVRGMLNSLGKAHPEQESPSENNRERDDADDDNVLLIKDNIEALDYSLKLRRRTAFAPGEFPAARINGTKPKDHQFHGFAWLRSSWLEGWPGVLLADDMGLGKTFQALAFLAWIKENQAAQRGRSRALEGPFLVVAPTALLDNWKKEADIHLREGTLGTRIDAFGPSLKNYKLPRHSSLTAEDALDVEQMRQADWILTTYETLALYHRAFARLPYSVAIFDEMQKVKAPDTINSHAAKTMNIDFVLGMTGTPIENRLEDLWSLMDRIAPGYLGELKAFSAKYNEEDPEALRDLKRKLDQKQGSAPPIMLRRMKDEVAKDLPAKNILTYAVQMPPPQAAAYDSVVASAKASTRSRKSMLETLHQLRGLSLHPDQPKDPSPYDAQWRSSWIAASARLSKAFSLLEEIHDKSEKALVFLEDRAMQQILSAAVAEHFGMRERPPVINGTLGGKQRQDIVDGFQKKPHGFDLLILSPKAAGIGLTITAANHVIHLSRWWNPAVEDQCNDRAFRIGQTKDVFIHVPMAIHPHHQMSSFDAKLNALLQRKRVLSRDMLAPPTSERDVDSLFDDIVG